MTIHVTQEDIDSNFKEGGARCSRCPVAMAISRATGQSVKVFGGPFWIGGHFGHLPNSVVKKIIDLDNQKPIGPFTFELEPPTLHCAGEGD